MKNSKVIIRPAEEKDCADIVDLIKGLAEYEKMSDQVTATPELLKEWLFDKPAAEVLLAEHDCEIIAYALSFYSFSTFLGKPGLYLEDVYVKPEYRSRGIGKDILRRLAKSVVERGYGRLEWACLDWNQPSIDLYLSFGAKPLDDWTTFRLTGDALEDFSSCRK